MGDQSHSLVVYIGVAIAVVLCISGQSVQNVYLPIVLSSGHDMGVIMVFTALFYFIFFTLLDIILDIAIHVVKPVVPHRSANRSVIALQWASPPHKMFLIGLFLTLNGTGAMFGGSATRTPLPVQMSLVLLISGCTPLYRSLRAGGIARVQWLYRLISVRARLCYISCLVMYIVATILVVSDQVANLGEGSWSAFTLMFAFGIACGLLFNVEQDLVMAKSPIVARFAPLTPSAAAAGDTFGKHVVGPTTDSDNLEPLTPKNLPLLLLFKREVSFVRSFITWEFFTSWIAVGVSAAGWNQSGPLTHDSFDSSWTPYLTLSSRAMNAFNFGQVGTLLAAVFINRYTSTLTLLVSNVSAVTAMFAGFSPSIQMETVGFEPSIPKTTIAAILAFTAVVPSMLFSSELHRAQQVIDDQLGDEDASLLQ